MFRLPNYFATLGLATAISAFTFPLQAQTESVEPPADKPVSVSAELKIRDGNSARLIVKANIADGFHIYAQSQPKPFLATHIEIDASDQFQLTGPFTATVEPHRRQHPALDVELHEFEHVVSWNAPVQLLGSDLDSLTMTGHVFAQACTADRCLAPQKYLFTAKVTRIETSNATANVAATESTNSISEQPSASSDTAAGFSLQDIEVQSGSASNYSLTLILPLALLAGFLLNFMPCVLPVVGLKVLSFVEQASDSRRKIFMLNLSYASGLMSVMLVLASLAAFA